MRKCVIINSAPIAADESRNQQQERALRLMKIRDHRLHNLIRVARRNDAVGDLAAQDRRLDLILDLDVDRDPRGVRQHDVHQTLPSVYIQHIQ